MSGAGQSFDGFEVILFFCTGRLAERDQEISNLKKPGPGRARPSPNSKKGSSKKKGGINQLHSRFTLHFLPLA